MKNTYFKELLILIAVILFTGMDKTHAQSAIEIADTSLQGGVVHDLPVYGTLPAGAQNVELEFRFNALLLDFKSAFGNESTILTDPFAIQDISGMQNSVLRITAPSTKQSANGILCYLKLETLAGPDSTASLSPVSITINGEIQEDPALDPGTIFIGQPVFQEFPENLGNIYPNPFYVDLNIGFTINEPSKVNFKMFNLAGVKIFELNGNDENFEYHIFDRNGSEIDKPESHTFEKGSYRLYMIRKPRDVAAGTYFLVMETSFGTYKKNVIHIK
ncbi:MAG: hypothetical protein ACLFR2_04630 [Candidatus Kapaibacterium sp.]